MSPAGLSVVALVLVVLASLGTRVNVGVLAMSLAWPIAVYAAGWRVDALMAVFPTSLFITLLGVTALFGTMQSNGTMAALVARAVAVSGGRAAWLPPLLFMVACLVSTMGPGAIATVALLAPLGMAAAMRAGVPALLVALMIGNGANAGNLSPFSAVGVIVDTSMARAGLEGYAWTVWTANFVAHVLAAAAAWALFGGPRLLRATDATTLPPTPAFERRHGLTLMVGAAWVVAVVVLNADLGLAAFAAAALLVLIGAADDAGMLRHVPWAVIVLVCGVSTLVGVLDRTGGLDIFSAALASVATPSSINGTIAFITGTISSYSSTSGVVYPTFLPTIPSLVERLGGGDPLQIALSINVGAALVDVSPLSTLGALCIAAVPDGIAAARLFRSLLLWGLSMTVVGALFCQFCIAWFAG